MDNTNLIVAIVLSVLILVGFQYLYIKPQQEQYRQQVLAEKLSNGVKPATTETPSVTAPRERAEVLKDNPRLGIETPELRGSINLKGGRLDDLQLARYRVRVENDAPNVQLLSPAGSAAPDMPYYAEFSWLAEKGVAVPTADAAWTSDGGALTPQHPVTLTWSNREGLTFTRVIEVDDQFMFTLTDHVRNNGAAPVTLYPFGIVARQGNPITRSSSISHEGPLGVMGGALEEFKYKKLMDDGKRAFESEGGWVGITDKYWLVAMMPEGREKLTAEFAYNRAGQNDPNLGWFQSDFRGAPITVAAAGEAEHRVRFFAGAKRVRLLDHYGSLYDIPHFDRAIDFGWFYFLTKPFLYLLGYLGGWIGHFGLAILLFTVLLKLATLPLSLKSYHSMSRMKALQPEMQRLQERYKDDKVRQSQEMMEIYKREKVSPLSGCVPTLIQIPIFFALYKVLYVGIELRQAPFFGWIKDMSVPDPTSVFTAFGLLPIALPAALHIGVWPIIMGLSMFLQQKMSPQPPDKTQAKMFLFMPILFTYMLANMPAGLVIYWTWSNLLGIAQQAYIMRKDAAKKQRRRS